MMERYIAALLDYGCEQGLIAAEDRIYVRNQLLDLFGMDSFEETDGGGLPLEEILSGMLAYAYENGIIASDDIVTKDAFDTRIMGLLTPRPSQVIRTFEENYRESPEKATDEYYRFSKATNYIRAARVAKDRKWVIASEYGDIDITINLSKPEKDPKAIAAALKVKAANYPKCLLCKENEGFAGRGNHPARQNHRIIPLTMNQEQWYLQYSPYVYYNEHCIVFRGEHTPMRIDHSTFVKLLDFVTLFPHYFLGSNADLPIVGGSILTHDHFQGGRYEFAMAKAPVETSVVFDGFPQVSAGIVRWPMSVLRLRSEDREALVALCDRVLSVWRGYTDAACTIFAETDGVPHNTITPIARMRDGAYEMDLVLRNNLTTEEHPLGLYHPHEEHHHIKKENIGLIEVMGLAVLPSRLEKEMQLLREALLSGADIRRQEAIEKHADWVEAFLPKHPSLCAENADRILEQEIGNVYVSILEQAGVYKRNAEGRQGFLRFVKAAGGEAENLA